MEGETGNWSAGQSRALVPSTRVGEPRHYIFAPSVSGLTFCATFHSNTLTFSPTNSTSFFLSIQNLNTTACAKNYPSLKASLIPAENTEQSSSVQSTPLSVASFTFPNHTHTQCPFIPPISFLLKLSHSRSFIAPAPLLDYSRSPWRFVVRYIPTSFVRRHTARMRSIRKTGHLSRKKTAAMAQSTTSYSYPNKSTMKQPISSIPPPLSNSYLMPTPAIS